MNRKKKPTLVLTSSGRADFVVRDAASDQRLSMSSGVAVLFLGLILATLIRPAPALADAFSASGSLWQEFYPAGPPGTSSVSPTGATFSQQFVAADINLSSNAAASSGNLSLSALASINNMGNWSSGHVSSVARGGIIESVAPAWQSWLAPGETLIFEYAISVSGNLFTTSGGIGAGGSQAGLQYSYRLGDSSGGGQWWQNSAGQVSKSGTWNGVISSTFTVDKDSTFLLELLATADAGGGKTYVPGSNATIVANADFSHTMRWLGISGVRALDGLGNEVELPSGAYIPLIGQDSGFDYWHAAPPIPEPGTVVLLGSGLVVVGQMRRSVVRRRDS